MEKVINFSNTTDLRRIQMINRVRQLGFDVLAMQPTYIHVNGTATLWQRLAAPSDMPVVDPNIFFNGS